VGGWETAEARCVHAERARAEGEKRRGSAAAAGRAGRDEGEAEAGPPGELGLGSGAGDALLTAHSSALTAQRRAMAHRRRTAWCGTLVCRRL
jgi:hypothetical protein